jgi:hypothetical protein
MAIKLNVPLTSAADTFAAAVSSVLDFLGDKHPLWEIQGLSGYAFRILVHKETCPSGPHHTNWKEIHPATLRRLGWEPNFFLHIDWNRTRALAEKREQMLRTITAALDQKRPVIVYDLYVPEWGLVTGYDESARELNVETFLNLAHWKAVSYDKLGAFNLPILYALDAGARLGSYDRESAYREALASAVRHYNLQEYTWRPTVRDGKEAYSLWLSSLKSYPASKVLPEGVADYAAKFGEWRASAAKFCREAAKVLPENKDHLLGAAAAFEAESKAFAGLAKLFPAPGGKGIDKAKVAQAVILVQKAQTHYNAAIADMRAARL